MADDAEAIARQVLSDIERCWGDATAIGELFIEDADLVHGNGMHDIGREAIAATMARAFSGMLKDVSASFELLSARPIGTDAVLVRASLRFLGPAEERPPLLTMLVAVRDRASWKIVALQNTPTAV